jgi:hypothetical protein
MARARKMENAKKQAGGKSQLADNAKALNIVCQIWWVIPASSGLV